MQVYTQHDAGAGSSPLERGPAEPPGGCGKFSSCGGVPEGGGGLLNFRIGRKRPPRRVLPGTPPQEGNFAFWNNIVITN